MKKLYFIIAAAIVLLSAPSCKKDTDETTTPNNNTPTTPVTPDGMVKIGETYIIGAKAKAYIYAKQNLFVGYNTIYAAMYDSADGSRLVDGHFTLGAEMDMGMMKHSCPIEVNEDIDATTKLYSTSLVFIMPGSDMAKWKLSIAYHNHKIDMEGEGEIEVPVVAATPKRLVSSVIALDDSAKVFVSFVLPTVAKVGLNDAEFTIHKMASTTDFPAITDYTIEMTPTMPSMGHGSPNNVNPTHVANGHYVGKLNFTMDGLWQIDLKLSKNGVLLKDDIKFEITL
ncbi:MAG: FixH family protein [Bacteroidia bacterium]|nr:FixH family protein [Bacteroidia bacterium]MCF8446313.1 FixH family protein [Bacteroidia bacterium]